MPPDSDQPAEAQELVRLLQQSMTPEEFQRTAEELLHPELKQKREAEEEALRSFVNGLVQIPAGFDLPEDFGLMWEKLLVSHEEQQRDRLIRSGELPERLENFIKRGWLVANPLRMTLESREERPADGLYPIPAVLVFMGTHWDAPTILSMQAQLHPFVRAISKTIPTDPQARFRHLLKWAEGLHGSTNEYDIILAQRGQAVSDLLYAEMFGDPEEIGWLYRASKSQRFWHLLDAAVDFGRRYALWRAFRDGTLEKKSRRGHLMRSKQKSPWRRVIDEELAQHHSETGAWLKPAQLRKHMGCKPVAADDLMTFSNLRFAGMEPITWKEFQIIAKKSREKLDL